MRTTFSRNSAAWAFGANRFLTRFETEVPRIEYDPATGERLGLLIEDQQTTTVGTDLTASAWRKSNVTLEPAETIAGIDMYRMRETAVSGVHCLWQMDVFSPSSSTEHADVFIAADVGTRYVTLVMQRMVETKYSATHEYAVIVDLQSGEIIYQKVNLRDAALEQIAPALYRIRVSRSYGGTAGYPNSLSIGMLPGDGDYTVEYAGDGESSILIGLPNASRTSFATTSPIIATGNQTTRAADFLDAPGANNEYGPGLHTWRGAVRMSRDPGEPTVLGYADGRIYASDGRLHLDGPGTLWQPDGEHAPGDYVPFYWTTQFSGATPDFALGRGIGDTDWWNGHLVDIVPYPRTIRESEIRQELGL